MLYSFDILYFEETSQNELPVTFIWDLPQKTIREVRLNPFVFNLVNHSFIRDGIARVPNHQGILVDNVYSYTGDIQNNFVEISCRYQEKCINSDYKSFEFTVRAIIPPNRFFPQDPFVFICGELYDAYEFLYESGCFIKAPIIPVSKIAMAVGYYYRCILIDSVELLKVTSVGDTSAMVESVSEKGGISQMNLDSSTLRQVQPLRLNDKLLGILGFTFENNSNVYGLKGVNLFVGVVNRTENQSYQLFIKKNRVGYDIIVEDSSSTCGCRLIRCFYLHEMQYYLLQEYNTLINLKRDKVTHICQHINKTERLSRVISKIPEIMNALYSQNPQPTREQVIVHIATCFNMKFEEAQRLLVLLHL